jgi:hypothetical protein
LEVEDPEHRNEPEMIAPDYLYHARCVRFAHDTDQDPQVTHRRHLDAIRAKEYRNRRKNEQCVGTTTDTRHTTAIDPIPWGSLVFGEYQLGFVILYG